MKIGTRVSHHENYIAKTRPKRRRNPYPSERAMLIRDLDVIGRHLEAGTWPSREWCLEGLRNKKTRNAYLYQRFYTMRYNQKKREANARPA